MNDGGGDEDHDGANSYDNYKYDNDEHDEDNDNDNDNDGCTGNDNLSIYDEHGCHEDCKNHENREEWNVAKEDQDNDHYWISTVTMMTKINEISTC